MKNILGNEKECAYYGCYKESIGLYSTKHNEEDTDNNIYYWCLYHHSFFISREYIVKRIEKSKAHVCKLVCKCNAKEAVLL